MYAASSLHCSVLHAKLFVRWRPEIRKMALRPRGRMFQRVNKICPWPATAVVSCTTAKPYGREWDRSTEDTLIGMCCPEGYDFGLKVKVGFSGVGGGGGGILAL